MTRINTNVSSLVAQNRLGRSNADLQTALTRLSTGLRINTGKDDPAGLIASEALRSDIISIEKAIVNSERANQVIATADSALGQVSSLLNDIRGLVTEAANSGALSDDQIAANQLQIDSSLEALNRIAQTTSFQGRRLLDGSLDFITTAGTDFNEITDLKIEQANLGATGEINVEIEVTTAATQAEITTDIDATTAAVAASAVLTFVDVADVDEDYITVTADTDGTDFNDIEIEIVESDFVVDGEAIANFNGTDKITVYVSDAAAGNTSIANITAAIDDLDDFSAVATDLGSPDGNYTQGTDADGVQATTAGGVDSGAGLLADLVFELTGVKGAEVFSFQAGATVEQVAAAINLVSDATGVEAAVDGDELTLTSTAYGEKAFVDVNIISEGGLGVFGSGLSGTRETGGDVVANVNGVSANADGNQLSINTAVLDLTARVTAGYTGTIDFSIDSGGALFQLGPDVVSNQQARLGIQSVNTARLGGVNGRLFELGSGGNAALATNATLAAEIVDEVISKVTGLRGRLGAFQKTTLDSNIASLNDTLSNLTEAESAIRDADFAAESARLTRAQILVQSGTTVLAIANSNPQNVLALLR